MLLIARQGHSIPGLHNALGIERSVMERLSSTFKAVLQLSLFTLTDYYTFPFSGGPMFNTWVLNTPPKKYISSISDYGPIIHKNQSLSISGLTLS